MVEKPFLAKSKSIESRNFELKQSNNIESRKFGLKQAIHVVKEILV